MNCVICHRSGESIRNDEIAAEIARHEERERAARILEEALNAHPALCVAVLKEVVEQIRGLGQERNSA